MLCDVSTRKSYQVIIFIMPKVYQVKHIMLVRENSGLNGTLACYNSVDSINAQSSGKTSLCYYYCVKYPNRKSQNNARSSSTRYWWHWPSGLALYPALRWNWLQFNWWAQNFFSRNQVSFIVHFDFFIDTARWRLGWVWYNCSLCLRTHTSGIAYGSYRWQIRPGYRQDILLFYAKRSLPEWKYRFITPIQDLTNKLMPFVQR